MDALEAMKQAINAMQEAMNSHGRLLMSDPPQDPWKTRRVDDLLRDGIAALDAAVAQAEQEQPVAPSESDAERMGATGGPASDAERAAFEAWMRGHCWPLSAKWDGKQYIGQHEDEGFINPHAVQTRRLWSAWRDRAALAAEQAHPARTVSDERLRELLPEPDPDMQGNEYAPGCYERGYTEDQMLAFARAVIEESRNDRS